MHPSLDACAARRGGAFTRAEALAAGYTPAEIRQHITSGRWCVLRRGVYAKGPDAAHRLYAAAALALLDQRAAVSHRSAARLHDLPVLGRTEAMVEVTIPGAPARRAAGVWVNGRGLPACDVQLVDGLRVTGPARTAFDLARRRGFASALVTCDAVLHRWPDLRSDLVERAAAGVGPGSARARRVVAFADGNAESPGESLSRLAIAAAGLPAPRTQQWLGDHDEAIGRVDFFWPGTRTVGEFDGRGKYVGPDAVWAEKLREDRLRDAGFEVVRWTWAEVFGSFAAAADRLRRAFARGSQRGSASSG